MFDTPSQSSSIKRVFNGYDSVPQSNAISRENSRLNRVSASCDFEKEALAPHPTYLLKKEYIKEKYKA